MGGAEEDKGEVLIIVRGRVEGKAEGEEAEFEVARLGHGGYPHRVAR